MTQNIIYTATWCGPCKTLKAALPADIKVEWIVVDEGNEEKAIANGVKSVPTLVVVEFDKEKGDVIIDRVIGVPAILAKLK